MINKCHYEQEMYYTVLIVCPLYPPITKQQKASQKETKLNDLFFF